MKFNIPIPDHLKHLPLDERGYPIPYFVPIVNGKPDFRLLDIDKRKICVNYHKCAICGGKLVKGSYWFLSGPIGAANQVSSDPPMHRECAEFSTLACPHLQYQHADRRDTDLAINPYITGHIGMKLEKPPFMVMVQADKFEEVYAGGGPIIKYRGKKYFLYEYLDGRLYYTLTIDKKELDKYKDQHIIRPK